MHALIRTQDYLELCSSIILILNSSGNVEYINHTGSVVMECSQDELTGKDWFANFVTGDSLPCQKLRFQNVLAGKHIVTDPHEIYLITAGGEEKLILWKSMGIIDSKGNIVGVMYSGEDITEKKILQQRLALFEKEKRKSIVSAILEAQEKERFYIANELHDSVGQILTTCKLLLEGEMQKQEDPSFLVHTYSHLQTAINEIRSISHQLNPAQLQEMGLINAIKELLSLINTSGKVVIVFNYENPQDKEPDKDIALSLFRIIQEQLNNIIKHSKARNVEIRLFINEMVEIEIIDNGIGFNPSEISRGLGLKNIHHRAELYGGKAFISSTQGEGCTLSVCIPLCSK